MPKGEVVVVAAYSKRKEGKIINTYILTLIVILELLFVQYYSTRTSSNSTSTRTSNVYIQQKPYFGEAHMAMMLQPQPDVGNTIKHQIQPPASSLQPLQPSLSFWKTCNIVYHTL